MGHRVFFLLSIEVLYFYRSTKISSIDYVDFLVEHYVDFWGTLCRFFGGTLCGFWWNTMWILVEHYVDFLVGFPECVNFGLCIHVEYFYHQALMLLLTASKAIR